MLWAKKPLTNLKHLRCQDPVYQNTEYCAGVLCDCWWAERKGSQGKSCPGMLLQQHQWKERVFPLSLTTSSGQNAIIQEATTCWSQQGCLPRDFDAYPINGKGNPTEKDLLKCFRWPSPCTGAGLFILNDRCLSKPIFKKPPWSSVSKFSASVPVLWFCCYCVMGKTPKQQPTPSLNPNPQKERE